MSDLLNRVVLPVASDDDAEATARALDGHEFGSMLAVHVVEKAGGAPDKAGVEQREAAAEEAFAILESHLGDADLDTEIRYDTDVADAIFAAADEFDASAIVITPRGGSRWIQLLTGDVALSLVTETDRPVVVLPDVPHPDGGEPAADATDGSEPAADATDGSEPADDATGESAHDTGGSESE
ncbi:universal stress protein [Halosimplex litoreum]|uniref:Universal stress protein n=1 Tax=Halosimplex litoreum TaxID=1198301 RepID=A0A7T3KVE5_9EURY|nr:universal stress protein [Halosimplex litoreum]